MQNWEEGEKKINRKAYQSQQRALGSMIIRGQWDAHMGDKEKKSGLRVLLHNYKQNYVSKHSLFLTPPSIRLVS